MYIEMYVASVGSYLIAILLFKTLCLLMRAVI